jgi:hypothetical protein
MKADIAYPQVTGVFLALVFEPDYPETPYTAYLINENKESLKNAMVVSKGYGELDGEHVQTSTLRHFYEVVDGQSFQRIEPISAEAFGLTNEYWISYFIQEQVFDKKFIILPGTTELGLERELPFIKQLGILIG